MISSDRLSIVKNWDREQVVRIVVARVDGSAPREAGASMWVSAEHATGTIGGGRLEYEALALARSLLAASSKRADYFCERRSWPLGPAIGQCCGGTVFLLFEVMALAVLEEFQKQIQQADGQSLMVHACGGHAYPFLIDDRHDLPDLPLSVARIATGIMRGERPRQPQLIGDFEGESWFVEPLKTPKKPLFIYGAGHVGQAIVKAIEDLDFSITWVDTHEQRFPATLPSKIKRLVAKNPQDIASQSPVGAYHLILTYSHEIDFELCRILLAENHFGYLGLIGSKTKRARFSKRLMEQGVQPETLSRLICPIGIDHITGKQPAMIAISVVAQLLQKREDEQQSRVSHEGSSHVSARR